VTSRFHTVTRRIPVCARRLEGLMRLASVNYVKNLYYCVVVVVI